jgi:hypothetical protein
MDSDEPFHEASPPGPKRTLRSGNCYTPIPAPVVRTRTRPDNISEPPNGCPLDTWFECSGFSALPQGATDAEIEDDLAQIHAGVAAINIKVGRGRTVSPLKDKLAVQAGNSTRSKSPDETIPFKCPTSNRPSNKFNSSLGLDKTTVDSTSTRPGSPTRSNPTMEDNPSRRFSGGMKNQTIRGLVDRPDSLGKGLEKQ